MTENKEMVEVHKSESWDEALENEAWIAPAVDIYETDDDYFLLATMAGVSKENVKIKLEDNHLVMMGRINYDDTVNRKYVLKESDTGNYYRKFKLSNSVNEENIEAEMDNGILNIKLPKHERVKPKTIQIK